MLASIDVMQFVRLSDLRNRFLELLEGYLKSVSHKVSGKCPEGEEFHFMSSRIFVIPTGHVAGSVNEFRELLKTVSIHSIYFHVFEAKLRLEKGDNDFSIWLRSAGREKEAEEISRLDPYTFTLEGLRDKILTIVGNSK
jgi:hypothetical protein